MAASLFLPAHLHAHALLRCECRVDMYIHAYIHTYIHVCTVVNLIPLCLKITLSLPQMGIKIRIQDFHILYVMKNCKLPPLVHTPQC